MEDERWLRHVLEAGRRALARLRQPGIQPDPQLLADLEAYCASLDKRLEAFRRPGVEGE